MGNSTKELVNAFNLNNYACDKISTNFTVEGKKIFGLFASSTNIGEYLQRIGEKIIKRHYLSGTEVASRYYNLNCFPFVLGANPDKEHLGNGIVKVKLADSTDKVIHNLKIHFANEFERAVGGKVVACLQKLGVTKEEAYEWIEKTVKTRAIGMPYLYCIAFNDEYLEQRYNQRIFELLKSLYIREFNSRLEACGLKGSDFYKYKDDMLYVENVSDKVIKNVTEYVKKEVAFDFRTPGSVEPKVKNCKNVLSELILKATGKFVDGYDYDDFTDENKINNGHSFALIPFIKVNGQLKSLSFNDAGKMNRVFNKEISNSFMNSNFISDIRGKTANPQFARCKEPVYAFSNKQIALLLPKIMESPIAYRNGLFEFAQALSPAQSPLNSPTHAGPSGLKTPPNKRKNDTDSGYDSNSPPKHKDSGSSSGGPRSLFGQPQTQRFPMPSHDGALKESPRQGSEKEALYNHVNPDGPSKGFSPSPQLNSIAVSYGVSGPSSSVQSVSAAQNVRAGTSPSFQPIGYRSSLAPSAGFSPSGPPSWSSPPPAHENKWTSSLPFTKPGLSGLSWTQSGPSSCSSPASSAGFSSLSQSRPSSWKGAQAGANISEEEKKLIKVLLYTLNLTNYTYGGVYTNFFAKDGKIVSCLHDNVDREKYFQAVRNYIIKEYYEDEKEASKVCDLDEFPFKLNCEEKQETTVVANISSGALSNLKILFSQKFGKSVDAIDISAVKKVEEREKDEWVDRQLFNKDSLEEACEDCFLDEEAIEEACEDCFPDEEAMKIIPIAFEEGEYVLDRSRDTCEVKLLLREQLRRFRGTSVAGKGESDDKPLTEEEKELFKALLYAFNYSNHDFDLPDTNFIVKNGKIASLISDSVDVKEYLQKVRDSIIKEHCKDKKEAYYLDEFPFTFLSNCKKNQETTVIAEISRGALFNLEKLFIYGYKEEVKIGNTDIKIGDINIDIVEETVKSKKDKLVDSKLKGIERKGGYCSRIKRYEAATASFPDESALEGIPIIEDKGGYYLDRTYEPSETKLFVKDLGHTEDRSKAGKVKPEDNKDSGYSSGFVTDAENVSSKAEATTSSGYESMDCENTREGLPKRSLELSMESLAISTTLNAPQPSPAKKLRNNEV